MMKGVAMHASLLTLVRYNDLRFHTVLFEIRIQG